MNSLGQDRREGFKNAKSRVRINAQYLLMEQYLQQFDNNNLTLDRLINVLDALLETLQNPDEEWKENFRTEWWTLEQIYAVACDRGETKLNLDSQNLVYETIENMKNLLKEVIQIPSKETTSIEI